MRADPVGNVAREKVTSYTWYVLTILFVINIFNYIDRQILSILMESIKVDLSLSDTQLGFLTGITFAIFYAGFGVPLARLADRWSRRNVIVASLALWSAFTAICGMARTFPQLLSARIAVAIGEAGCTPSAHSMLTDLFPDNWRVRAIAIYSLGLPVGILIGLSAGGWINEHFSWRYAFILVGLPGVALALLALLTIREPKRIGNCGSGADPSLSVWATFKELWRRKTYRHILIASSLNALGAYGIAQWTPTFFIRSHGMGTAELGLYMGLVSGLAGAVGVLGGGWLAEYLGRRNPKWYALVPAAAMALATPFYFGVFFSSHLGIAFAFLAIPSLLNSVYISPVFASVQMLSRPATRAVAASILLFAMNLIGLGLGPQIVGILSDLFAPAFGRDSLRWALCSVALVKGWSFLHYWIASRNMAADLEEARG